MTDAVDGGKIDAERFRNYLKIKKESDFYEMSYLEKRKREKKFAKVIKNYNKMQRDRD